MFLGYSNLHKGFKCLNVSGGHVYISRDVVFDETDFPFTKLTLNVGTHLHEEILLLPSSSTDQPSSDPGGESTVIPSAHVHILPVSTNVVPSCAVPAEYLEQNGAGIQTNEVVEGSNISYADCGTGTRVDSVSTPTFSAPITDPGVDWVQPYTHTVEIPGA
jgi:hypothetical protein